MGGGVSLVLVHVSTLKQIGETVKIFELTIFSQLASVIINSHILVYHNLRVKINKNNFKNTLKKK